jgi:cystathionine gamma-synthase
MNGIAAEIQNERYWSRNLILTRSGIPFRAKSALMKAMNAFPERPLGQAIPDSPHAVSVSLPTMHAVRGYEEKDPEIVRHLALGYPRFVVHPFARQLAQLLGDQPAYRGRKLWLVSSSRMAQALAGYLLDYSAATEAFAFEDHGLNGVAHVDEAQLGHLAKLYLQHLGGFVSTREAEDQLVRRGQRAALHPEAGFAGDGAAEVRRVVRRALPGTQDHDLFVAPNGMNAVYGAFRAVGAVQAPRGRTEWVQLGWLYLDTIAILKKFTGEAGYHYRGDVFDLEALEALFAARGSKIAGLITEVPTNPLVQTADVAALSDLCRRYGVSLILDPSVNSIFAVNVLPYADLVTASLTKYTGSDGDIIAGLVAVNPEGRDAGELRRLVAGAIEPIYPRDLSRLAAQIGQTETVLREIGAATSRVARFLQAHPAVKEVFWALQPNSAENFERLTRFDGVTGGMISFVLQGELAPFYDRLRLAKGPSFGQKTTLICPFMYLAHYDLVTSGAGREELRRSGLSPDLLRLCVGTEGADAIIAALAEALG